MRRRKRGGWLLAVVASMGLGACVIDTDDSESAPSLIVTDAGTAGRAFDAGNRVCTPGSTQLCYGPGACEGAQVCELHGLSWGPCDCGDGGSGSPSAEPSGNGGVAGAGGGDTAGASVGASGGGGSPIAASCVDGIRNQGETDVDCGGPACEACAPGEQCEVDADCSSGVCTSATCQAPYCTDGVLNGDETDVDCGGADCSPCPALMNCRVGADCTSGSCTDGVCDPE